MSKRKNHKRETRPENLLVNEVDFNPGDVIVGIEDLTKGIVLSPLDEQEPKNKELVGTLIVKEVNSDKRTRGLEVTKDGEDGEDVEKLKAAILANTGVVRTNVFQKHKYKIISK